MNRQALIRETLSQHSRRVAVNLNCIHTLNGVEQRLGQRTETRTNFNQVSTSRRRNRTNNAIDAGAITGSLNLD